MGYFSVLIEILVYMGFLMPKLCFLDNALSGNLKPVSLSVSVKCEQ